MGVAVGEDEIDCGIGGEGRACTAADNASSEAALPSPDTASPSTAAAPPPPRPRDSVGSDFADQNRYSIASSLSFFSWKLYVSINKIIYVSMCDYTV